MKVLEVLEDLFVCEVGGNAEALKDVDETGFAPNRETGAIGLGFENFGDPGKDWTWGVIGVDVGRIEGLWTYGIA